MNEQTSLHKILAEYWNFDSFRDKQEEIIRSILAGKDTLALLPTGGGKSICFQVPALAQEGICLVISPLIALMQDQVSNLKSRGIKALSISSAMSYREIDITLDNAAYGDYKFLYLSPERLETDLFKARLKKMKVSFIAVDEAHCISQWGYDFRPSYLNIAKIREELPGIPILALTATATTNVVDDIQEQLAFPEKNVIQKSFERKNLAYVVLNEENPMGRMLKIFDGVKGSGIVYVGTRKKTKDIANLLVSHGFQADFYHAGLDHQQRANKQNDWINNKNRIIVSTNAFGMGIDKPDVRAVVHLDAPESLEAYFQEAGRAGRDEQKAYAIFLNSPSTCSQLRKKVDQGFPSIEEIKSCYLALSNFLQIPIDGGKDQNFDLDLPAFTKQYKLDLFNTYHCLHFLEKEDYIHLSENFAMPSRLHIKLGKEDLYKFQVSNHQYDYFIKTLLRTYGGLLDDFVKINEIQLAQNTKLNSKKVIEILKRLEVLEVLVYEEKSKLPRITFTKPRLDLNSLRISSKNYKDRKKVIRDKVEAVIHYLENQHQCRSQMLLAYFGEKKETECGVCDYCLSKKKETLNQKEFDRIVSLVKQELFDESKLLSEITDKLKAEDEQKLIQVIESMLEKDMLLLQSGRLSLK